MLRRLTTHRISRRLTLLVCLVATQGPGLLASAAETDPAVVIEGRSGVTDADTTHLSSDDTAPLIGQSLTQLTSRLANLQLSSGGAGSYGDLLALRGLSNTPYFSDPAVTLYVDDLPLGGGATYPTGLFGFFDTALHRGPQGTAFGRAGQGGILVLRSEEAETAPSPSLLVSLGAGSYESRTVTALARTRSSDAFSGNIAASFESRDGFVRNTTIGSRVDDRESYSLAARGRWRVGPETHVTAQMLANRQRDGAQPLVPLGGPKFTVQRDREGRTDVDLFGAALKVETNTPLGTLSSVTSHTWWSLDPYTNQLVLPPALDALVRQSESAWNEELRLSGQNDAASWSIGAWLSATRTRGDVDRSLAGLFPIEVSDFRLRSQTAAVFGEWNRVLSYRWSLLAGARAETVLRRFERNESVPTDDRLVDRERFNALMPKLALRYQATDATTLAMTLARGVKPGGWSAFTANETLAPFDSERTNSLELSVATTLSDAASLVARAFVYDIRGYQIERSFSATDYLVVNARRARSVGGELEGQWRLSSQLVLSGSLGVTRATLRSFEDPFTGISQAGHRTPYAPSFDASFSVRYQNPSGWFAATELGIVGRTYYDESETMGFSQGKRTTIAARAGYRAGMWELAMFGENLANERYYSMIVPGVTHGVAGMPRVLGVQVSSRFN